jgi:signal-transduction protein with cAMP-binding, CBS, and nucleotidyltransferase domain
MNELYTFLRSFQVLTDEEIQLIVDNTIIKEFSKGTFLLREGEVSNECYLVLKGLSIRQGRDIKNSWVVAVHGVEHSMGVDHLLQNRLIVGDVSPAEFFGVNCQ